MSIPTSITISSSSTGPHPLPGTDAIGIGIDVEYTDGISTPLIYLQLPITLLLL